MAAALADAAEAKDEEKETCLPCVSETKGDGKESDKKDVGGGGPSGLVLPGTEDESKRDEGSGPPQISGANDQALLDHSVKLLEGIVHR